MLVCSGMAKREAELKSKLTKELKKQLPHYLILQYATAGAPDRSIVGDEVQTNWECKHSTPTFDCPGNQLLLCQRLELRGHCRYIIWWEDGKGDNQQTWIVRPRDVGRQGIVHAIEQVTRGFDISWLVAQIRKAHGI